MPATATPSRFFANVPQRDILIRGVPARSPTFYRQVRMLMGIFTADLAACRAELATHVSRADLSPLIVAPGRTLVSVHAFDYADTDVGPYGELAISIAVRPPHCNLPGPLVAARSVLTGAFHAFVIAMPVTTDIALWGGLDYFNFPKYLADIAFEDDALATTCTLRDRASGTLELAVTGTHLGARPLLRRAWGTCPRGETPNVCTFTSYPIVDGRPARADVRLHLFERGTRFRGSGLTVSFGEAGIGPRLRRLGLGRLLMYWDVPRAEAILYAPESLRGDTLR